MDELLIHQLSSSTAFDVKDLFLGGYFGEGIQQIGYGVIQFRITAADQHFVFNGDIILFLLQVNLCHHFGIDLNLVFGDQIVFQYIQQITFFRGAHALLDFGRYFQVFLLTAGDDIDRTEYVPTAIGLHGANHCHGISNAFAYTGFQHGIIAQTGDVAIQADVFDHTFQALGVGILVVFIRYFGKGSSGVQFCDGSLSVGFTGGLYIMNGDVWIHVKELQIFLIKTLLIIFGEGNQIAHIALVVLLKIIAFLHLENLVANVGAFIDTEIYGLAVKHFFGGDDVQHLELTVNGLITALHVWGQFGDFKLQILPQDLPAPKLSQDVPII
ncbi:hypothetical protein DSECCO2_610650 [anaerobic digester metagenome]